MRKMRKAIRRFIMSLKDWYRIAFWGCSDWHKNNWRPDQMKHKYWRGF
jgi:hypothetical protein